MHDGPKNWGFRNVHCADVDAMGEAVGHATAEESRSHFHSHTVSNPSDNDYPPDLDWIAPERITSYTELGHPGNTAQVHPHLFTNKVAHLAEEEGAQIILGSVMSINYTEGGNRAKSVTYKAKDTSDISDLPSFRNRNCCRSMDNKTFARSPYNRVEEPQHRCSSSETFVSVRTVS